jgi:hypothetical protein
MDTDLDKDPNPAIFVTFKTTTNYFFLLLFTLHHFTKKKINTEVTKKLESKFFLLFLLDVEGSGSVSLTDGYRSGYGRPKKHMDSTDPDSDPQH